MGPIAEKIQRATQCLYCCPLWKTVLLFCPLESWLAKWIRPSAPLPYALCLKKQNASLLSFQRTENSSSPLPSLPSANPTRDFWEACVFDPVSSWASAPSPLPLIAWCSSERGLRETLGAFETAYSCGTRWLLWLWISYYSWWLPSPRRLWIYWLVRGFGDCVRPQSRWYLWGVLGLIPRRSAKSHSSELLVSLSYLTCG